MSPVREWTGYAAVCDRCDTSITEEATGGEYAAFADRESCLDGAKDADAYVHEDEHGSIVLCERCHARAISTLAGDDDAAWDALYDREPRSMAALREWIKAQREEGDKT